MFHYIYRITNTMNGMYYVGMRSCRCEISEDHYFGSGKYIKNAIKKYGRHAFTKEIVAVVESRELLALLESEIVDEEFVARMETYNMATGGVGGKTYAGTINPQLGAKRSSSGCRNMSIAAKNRKYSPDGLLRRQESTREMTKNRKRTYSRGGAHVSSKKVMANGIVFSSGRECANHFSVTPATVVNRCKSDKWEWDYV